MPVKNLSEIHLAYFLTLLHNRNRKMAEKHPSGNSKKSFRSTVLGN